MKATAEMIKYAANAFLATKISFINEMAHLCELVGADVGDVTTGIGLVFYTQARHTADHACLRIPWPYWLQPKRQDIPYAL